MSNYISFKYENLATILRGRAFELVEFRLILCTLSDINFFPDINFVTTVSLSACNLLYLHSVCHGKEIILWDSVLRTNGQNKTIFSVYTVLIINWYKTTTNKCLSYETLFRFDFFFTGKNNKNQQKLQQSLEKFLGESSTAFLQHDHVSHLNIQDIHNKCVLCPVVRKNFNFFSWDIHFFYLLSF